MSSKFKVGDRVREKLHPSAKGKVIKVCANMIKIHWDGWKLEECEDNSYHSLELFELIPEASSYQSPVKERLVKEIQVGTYGHVIISGFSQDQVFYRIDRSLRGASAQDLRHAARVFNDLAEVLEGNKDD